MSAIYTRKLKNGIEKQKPILQTQFNSESSARESLVNWNDTTTKFKTLRAQPARVWWNIPQSSKLSLTLRALLVRVWWTETKTKPTTKFNSEGTARESLVNWNKNQTHNQV